MTTINNIEFSGILIHSVDEMPFQVINTEQNEFFGVLNIKMNKIPLSTIPLFILFSIDKTASMHYPKLDFVKETFKQMARYLASLEITVYISVHAFSNLVDVIIDKQIINLTTLDEIISKIEALTADGNTDLGHAINKANLTMGNYNSLNPEHNLSHIFMTDGEPTVGICNDYALCKCIDDRFSNIFIGYGLDHNAALLRKLGNEKNADYQMVDNIENTSLVYAEVLHRFLYPAANDVIFEIENGQIYDWQTNTWTNRICEPTLTSEMERFYQIKTTEPNLVNANISGKIPGTNDIILMDNASVLPDLIDTETEQLAEPNNLSKYICRQHVQELLFQARSRVDAREFKNKLKHAFRKIHKFMRQNNLIGDGFMQILCDDLSLTYRSFQTKHGAMYAIARSGSQGRQQSYNVRGANELNSAPTVAYNDANCLSPPPPPRISRTNTVSYQPTNIHDNGHSNSINNSDDDTDDDDFVLPPTEAPVLRRIDTSVPENNDSDNDSDNDYLSEDELTNHIPAETNTTCYATPSMLNTIRTMTQTD